MRAQFSAILEDPVDSKSLTEGADSLHSLSAFSKKISTDEHPDKLSALLPESAVLWNILERRTLDSRSTRQLLVVKP